MINSKKNRYTLILKYIILIVLSLFILLPVFWMVVTSLKSEAEVVTIPPRWLPSIPTFDAFIRIWTDYPFITYFKNSIIIVILSTLVSIFFSSLAGYGSSRFNFKGKTSFLTFLLITQMFPSIMLLIPFFKVLKTFGLINTHLGLILVYTSFSIPFCSWMMYGFFKSIPKELDQAARIDGCNNFQTYFKVILPLTLPGLASTAIYSFIASWNEYMFAFILTTSEKMKTVPVGIAEFNGYYKIMWSDLMAASIVASIPLLIIFIILQKYLISGLVSGGVKQ